jgi:flagellar basal body P-ring protein FlgI
VRETFVDLALNDPDFTTASNVEESINRFFGR